MLIKLFILYLTCWNVNCFLLSKLGPIRAEPSAKGDGPALPCLSLVSTQSIEESSSTQELLHFWFLMKGPTAKPL